MVVLAQHRSWNAAAGNGKGAVLRRRKREGRISLIGSTSSGSDTSGSRTRSITRSSKGTGRNMGRRCCLLLLWWQASVLVMLRPQALFPGLFVDAQAAIDIQVDKDMMERVLEDVTSDEVRELVMKRLELEMLDKALAVARVDERAVYSTPSASGRGSEVQGEEEALLERVGRIAVEWVNTQLTPRTDPECSWDWGHWRCEPQCQCAWHPKFGDYWPSRSCRTLRVDEYNPYCDPTSGDDVSLLEKLGSSVGSVSKASWRFFTQRVIPKTDAECIFAPLESWHKKKPICGDPEQCSYQYKFGDVTPNRSCRIRPEIKARERLASAEANMAGAEESLAAETRKYEQMRAKEALRQGRYSGYEEEEEEGGRRRSR